MGYVCHPNNNNNNNKTCVPLISFKRTSANITLHARKEPHFGGHNTLQGKCTPVLIKCPKGVCPGPMPLYFVNEPDAFSRMWSNYQDSTYRNSSEPATTPLRRWFTAPYRQSNALLHTGETLIPVSLFGFLWCFYFLRKVCHNKRKHILGIWR